MGESELSTELWRNNGRGGLRINVTFADNPTGLVAALEDLDEAYNEAKFQLLQRFQEAV
ncbi:hypothetical protein [Mycolicibacterium mucogenicum]|uniref:hypothetical protein n=1 Tax=Mycolicibacterium mucogenicum TaxID=56689 RepID=UPI000AC985C6|nr:hypothetical protein [Mycolicibacterium mucogenicum]